MTAKELLQKQLDDAGYQLAKVIEGLPEELMDGRSCPSAMTPRDSLAHLCEAYQAAISGTQGVKHEWGTFKIEDTSTANLIKVFNEMRARAVEAVLASDDPKWLWGAHLYMVAHDYYHVGQLASLRVDQTPTWDPYSIYQAE
jgi:hypothetical protein